MELSVGDVMTRGVICVDVNENVERAAKIMKQHEISAIIVTKDGDGVGILTERNILSHVVAEHRDPRTTKVGEIMTSPLITISPDADIDEAAAILRDKNIRRLVVENDGKIVGVISEYDIIRVEPALHLLIREHSKWDITDISRVGGDKIAGICESCENYSDNLNIVDGRLICEECMDK